MGVSTAKIVLFVKAAQSYGGAKIAFSSCQHTHRCCVPDSWAARHTTMCLDVGIFTVVIIICGAENLHVRLP